MVFVDREHGWLAGWGGVYATEDGGRTWRDLELIHEEETARGVRFLSCRQGFVVVNSDAHNRRRDTLLRTDDGGATWREVYAAPPPALWPWGLMRFFADGAGVGAGEGGEVLSTRDSGRTWTAIGKLPDVCGGRWAQFGDWSFPDREHGWATVTCAGRAEPVLYRTVDGGATWTAAGTPGAGDDGYTAVSFVSRQTGYVVTEAGYLLRADDGGATLAPVDGVAEHTPTLEFATKERGWEVRGDRLFATRDGGRSWAPVPFGYPVQQFALLADGRAWVAMGDGRCGDTPPPERIILATSGDRESWTAYKLGPIPCNWRQPWLDSLQFADALHGWLSGDTALYYTDDGGESWTQLH